MSESKANKTATQKLIAKYPYCCFCGPPNLATTREHYPPKTIFNKKIRPNDLVVPACRECNANSSTADQYAGVISRLRFGENAEIEESELNKYIKAIVKLRPDVASEMISAGSYTRRKLDKENPVTVRYMKDTGSRYATIGSEGQKLIRIFSKKLTLALSFDRLKRYPSNESLIFTRAFTNFYLINRGLPRAILDGLGPPRTLSQGALRSAAEFSYRDHYNEDEQLYVVFARLRSALYVWGAILFDRQLLKHEETKDWRRVFEQE